MGRVEGQSLEPKVNILLVDDQPANLLALEAILHGLDVNLVRASSGEEALRHVLTDDFAVILMDVRMPGMDGYETARLIRSREKSRHTPIIFVTAHEAVDTVVVQAYKDGASDHLVKPLVPDILKAKVGGFADLFRMRMRIQQMERANFERELAEEKQRWEMERLREEARKEKKVAKELAHKNDELARLYREVQAEVVERKRAEEAARQSEERFRMMADTVPDIIFTFHPDGSTDYVSPRFYEYTGLPPGGAEGFGWERSLHPDDAEATRVQWAKSCETGSPFEIKYRFRAADGTYRWFIGRARPIFDDQGRIVKWFGSCTEIDDLVRADEALKEADRRKDEFLAMLAHELRNPLAPIRNAVQIMKAPAANDSVRVQARGLLERQVEHLVRLIDDLLDVSRITRGKIQLRKEPVALADVVSRAVETSRPLIDERRHQLTVELPSEPVFLDADITRLSQVLANLLNNAGKYTEEGGQIWLTAECVGGEAVIKVRDTGMGITPEILPRVFDLFTQADRSLDRSQGGLGIGLTLVRSLVQMHGGTVQAFSDGSGLGSEFVVRLPTLTTAVPQESPNGDGPVHVADGPPRRILVVDDNVDAAESLAMLLRASGHEVLAVHEGRTAIESMQTFRPEVVLLDIGLPVMNGYEVARRLQEEGDGAEVMLVALTGYGQEEDRSRSHAAGFDHHLVKPVDLEALLELLASAGRAKPVGLKQY
jgi:two-component system CheB/CheR fusion protein